MNTDTTAHVIKNFCGCFTEQGNSQMRRAQGAKRTYDSRCAQNAMRHASSPWPPEAILMEFSLCTIFKNEEKNLEKFITDHIDLVDEMILVDTGSTDRSNEIVRDHGLPYYFFQWTDHFAEARNYSLTFAAKPWIIVLDIDEQVLKEDFQRLKTIMDEKQKDAYSLKQINFTDNFEDMNWKSITGLPKEFHSYARGYIESPLIRVFRNGKGIHFHGAIHELVGESLKRLKLSSCKTDIPIYHLGWVGAGRSDEEKQRKKKAYREMIRREWEKDPSPKMAFYYISTLENPEEKLRLAFRLTREYPEIKQFWEIITRGAAGFSQWKRALSYAGKGLEHHPDHIPLLVIKAKCLNETANPQEALEILEPLRKKDPLHPVYWFETFKSLILMQRKEEAEALARQLPPQFPPDLAKELLQIIETKK
jgi:glycosyltransferase involved in cell wall biosynthesis